MISKVNKTEKNLLKKLNPQQREAVNHEQGPLLILAGAGSGKTRVLTYRIAYLISKLGVDPSHLLAVTFTNKAAQEMRERVEKLIGSAIYNLWIGTFHSMCARILRRDGEYLGIGSNFTIYDEKDRLDLIGKVMKDEDISEKEFYPKSIRSRISGAKSGLVRPENYPRSNPYSEVLIRLYTQYEKRLRKNNGLDFDDLLMKTVELFEEYPDIRMKYADRFQHVLVDEYQDTNHAQYRIVQLLSSKHRNLCVVGDEDQSIYGFRGADIRNILDFERDFPETKVIRLEENYRSTKTILEAASAVVEKNHFRKGKTLWSRRNSGQKITLLEGFDEEDEARRVFEILVKKNGTGSATSLRDIVILYRTNAQSRVLEEIFRRMGLPYVIVGGIRFYERQEIKDILAYLKVFSNPDDSVSLKRILNVPKRGIGKKTVEILEHFAEIHSKTLYQSLENCDEIDELSTGIKSTLKDFYEMCENLRGNKESESINDLLSRLFLNINYLKELEREGTEESLARAENVRELVVGAESFTKRTENPSLDTFLQEVSLFTELDRWDASKEAVTLMTAHNAKGLEYPTVIITGLEEGLFPHSSSYDSVEELEEERRLFYVAMTRASDEIFLTYARSRRRFSGGLYSRPSRFLMDIPPHLLDGDLYGIPERMESSSLEDNLDF
jgi:DNA helicase-2/ATP-dependent DNA helicase PcrA